MRAWHLADDTGAGPLRLVTVPDPEPGPNDVLVRTRAVALNYRDLVVARGGYRGRVPVGAIPCSDAAGEVVATGRDVSEFRVGDRVTSTFAPDWLTGPPTRAALRTTPGAGQAPGVLAELVTLPRSAVLSIPSWLTFEEAATLPCAALTAWHALFVAGACGPGSSVLTLGTGGVSTFAVQFACAAGAVVIATSSHAMKRDRLRRMGVAHVINYREEAAWGERARALTAGEEGVDLVVEVGGEGTLEQSMRAVRPGGTIALIGTLGGASAVNLAPLFLRNIRLQGTLAGSREMFTRMYVDLERWQIRPVIDRVFEFEDAPAAYAHLASAAHMGKVVVRVGDDD
ncbi:MAG: NAD(P)-dependent alcohol dehydrogenase [Acidobacteria bacterium]|nr:NAD(P)-dependent alcohol dehydrogenase [Acidobacteriota bacterium]